MRKSKSVKFLLPLLSLKSVISKTNKVKKLNLRLSMQLMKGKAVFCFFIGVKMMISGYFTIDELLTSERIKIV